MLFVVLGRLAHSMAHLRKPSIGAKILQKSFAEAEL